MGTTRNFLIKADLADAIYVALPVDKPKATQIVEDYIELIKEALEKEGKVVLAGFGTYEVKFKLPRKGRNPKTGDSLILRARKVVRFKISKPFRKTMNDDCSQSQMGASVYRSTKPCSSHESPTP